MVPDLVEHGIEAHEFPGYRAGVCSIRHPGYRYRVSYRLIYFGLGLLAVGAIALGVVFVQEGDSVDLPGPIESVTPSPGDIAIRQAVLEVDLEVGYQAVIFIDGFPIDGDNFEPATGVYRWAPNPASAVMTEWTPGDHTVRVEWRTVSGSPDFGSFEWTFRIQ